MRVKANKRNIDKYERIISAALKLAELHHPYYVDRGEISRLAGVSRALINVYLGSTHFERFEVIVREARSRGLHWIVKQAEMFQIPNS